jgi:hypothetical protein
MYWRMKNNPIGWAAVAWQPSTAGQPGRTISMKRARSELERQHLRDEDRQKIAVRPRSRYFANA